MSRIVSALALAAGLAAVSPAFAADMYGGAPAAPAYGYAAPAPATNWNGVYVGGQFGHAWGPADLNGTQAGLYAGINTNLGANVIAGVEGDINVSGQTVNNWTAGQNVKHESAWNATIRPRIGVGFDRVMPYATAGLALADDSVSTIGGSSEKTRIGYAAGAGVEGQITDKISAKGEFLHLGYGNSEHRIAGSTVRASTSTNVLRGGVAYRF